MRVDAARFDVVVRDAAASPGRRSCGAAELELKYLSFLSHDLNNNLGAIRLHLKLLRQHLETRPEFADQLATLDRTQQCIGHTSEGMRRMLTYARLRNRTTLVCLRLTNLHDVAAAVVSAYSDEADAKGVGLSLEVAPDTVIRSDCDLIAVVLQNLIGNAVKYSRCGTVRVRARGSASASADHCIVSVSDNGPGIGPLHLEDLFEAFRRGDAHEQEGLGLGLAIASEAANLLGATLSVESEVGVGSTFSFAIPFSPGPAPRSLCKQPQVRAPAAAYRSKESNGDERNGGKST